MKTLFGGHSLIIAQLLDALAGDLCPICHLVAGAEARQLDVLLHERVNDERTRRALCDSRGLCPEHTRLLLEVGGRGCHAKIALLYAAQAAALSEEIASLPAKGPLNGQLTTTCAVCQTTARTSDLYIELLARRAAEPTLRAAVTAGAGLCLDHLRRVYPLARPEVRALLRAKEAARLQALSADLREFARKSAQATQAQHEAFGAERDAWLRILRVYDGALPG